MPHASDAPVDPRAERQVRARLVVVIGPIASGKSTLAAEIADLLRSKGDAVAVVGLDTIAEMALPTLDDWSWAHEIHGKVVGAWLTTPMRTVIAEGPATQAEVEQVLHHVPGDVSVLRVLLVTSYETALERARAEPTRGISKDPIFLGEMYRRFTNELPNIVYDQRFDSEVSPPATLAASVVAALRVTEPADAD
jgi:energy-coupling factor transporter ATP-binding protein EcfA2